MSPHTPDSRLLAIGHRVRDARNRQGWNQDEFADRAGMHRAYIGMIENGRKDFRISTLYRLSLIHI